MSERGRKLGNLLIAAGAVLGAITIVAVALDYAPTLTPAMIKLMFHKGMAAGAVGLIIVGSWIARVARKRTALEEADASLPGDNPQRLLNEAPVRENVADRAARIESRTTGDS